LVFVRHATICRVGNVTVQMPLETLIPFSFSSNGVRAFY
jgi:hypothetical protein